MSNTRVWQILLLNTEPSIAANSVFRYFVLFQLKEACRSVLLEEDWLELVIPRLELLESELMLLELLLDTELEEDVRLLIPESPRVKEKKQVVYCFYPLS